jgi:hypothetical protein
MSRRNPTPGQRKMVRGLMSKGWSYEQAIAMIPESEPRINGIAQKPTGLTNIPRTRKETSRKIQYE